MIEETRQVGNATVVRLSGELTLQNSPACHQTLLEICARGPQRLVVDLSDVHYVDSAGVGTLIDVFRRLKRQDAHLALVGLNDMVRGVFEITKLDRVFSIFATQEEALGS